MNIFISLASLGNQLRTLVMSHKSRRKLITFSFVLFLLLFLMLVALETSPRQRNFMRAISGREKNHPHRERSKRGLRNMSDLVEKREFIYPWMYDKKCSNYDIKFGNGLPLVVLTSYPRSGNTWMRYLIEGSTGIFTGTIYYDKELFKLGYLGEGEPYNSGRVVAVKTHEESKFPNKVILPNEAKTVVIIRNPMRSLISHWGYVRTSSFFSHLDINAYNNQGFHTFVKKETDAWLNLYKKRLIESRRILVIFYENLLQDPIKEVIRILHFLNLTLNSKRLFCLKRNLRGPTEKKEMIKKIDPFTKDEKLQFQEAMKEILNILQPKNLTDIPEEYHLLKNGVFESP